jgi:hypothetical protein
MQVVIRQLEKDFSHIRVMFIDFEILVLYIVEFF